MHRQSVADESTSQLHKRLRIVNPCSVAVERMNFLFRQNGFYPVFSPSLETAAGINNKKVQFDREDIKNVDNSNYPLMLYNRTPLVKSQRISGERIFQVVGPQNSLVTYTHGEFTLRMAALFNSMEQLEEFESSYLICGINAESLNIDATLPPVGILETLSQEDRKFILDLEWKDPSELQVERANGRYEFAVGNTVTILATYFNISDPDTVRQLSSAQLNFYWDKELNHKESEWNVDRYQNQINVTYLTDSSGEKTVYPYAAELDPEYQKTDFVDTNIELIGYPPNGTRKERLDADNLKFGSSISEATYSYTLNSDKYVLTGVDLTDLGGFSYRNIPSPFNAKFKRDYVNINSPLEYSLSVDDRYNQTPSTIKVEIPVLYPVLYGMIDEDKIVNKDIISKIKADLRNNRNHWSEEIRLSYGTSTNGFFYYVYPSKFGRVSSMKLVPSDEDVSFRLLSITNLSLISGKKTSRIPIEYLIYVTRERLENPISILVE